MHFFLCSVGNEHVLVLNNKGQVYGWGSNLNCQLGFDPAIYGDFVRKPTLIPNLEQITQISAGSLHSAAWTSQKIEPGETLAFGTPVSVPDKFEHIQNVPMPELR